MEEHEADEGSDQFSILAEHQQHGVWMEGRAHGRGLHPVGREVKLRGDVMEFQQGAAHVVPCRDEHQMMQMLLPCPLCRFPRIADRGGGPVAKADLPGQAGGQCRRFRGGQNVVQPRMRGDAGDQQQTVRPLAEQGKPGLYPVFSTGQGDDAVAVGRYVVQVG